MAVYSSVEIRYLVHLLHFFLLIYNYKHLAKNKLLNKEKIP